VGRKALKRKLARRVLSGKLTVGEARARLGRDVAQKSATGAAWSTWPQPAPAYEPSMSADDYVASAFRAIPRPGPPAVVKSRRQAAVSARAADALTARKTAEARMLDSMTAGRHRSAYDPPPPAAKPLTGVERATVAALQRQRDIVGYDPEQREAVTRLIESITGGPLGLAGGV
jgi:hypothetical protein